MKTNARNQYLAKVRSIKLGQINAEVILDIGGGDALAAGIPNERLVHLGLKAGVEADARVSRPW